eukprot:3091281-Amphidinium_carterae.2
MGNTWQECTQVLNVVRKHKCKPTCCNCMLSVCEFCQTETFKLQMNLFTDGATNSRGYHPVDRIMRKPQISGREQSSPNTLRLCCALSAASHGQAQTH